MITDNEKLLISIFEHIEEAEDNILQLLGEVSGVLSSKLEDHLNNAYTAIESANTLIALHFGGIDKFAVVRHDLAEEENK